MHALLRTCLCSLAVALTTVNASVYFTEYAPATASQIELTSSSLNRSTRPQDYEEPRDTERLDLPSRVLARSKMSPQVAGLAAAGDPRVLRLTVQGNAAELGLLGGTLVHAPGLDGGETVIDLPGGLLDRFALQPSVQRVALLGVVAGP